MEATLIADLIKVNKVLHKIKDSPLVIGFPNLDNIENAVIQCYSDPSLAKLPSESSTGGHKMLLAGKNNSVSPIAWKSKILSHN